MGRRRVLDVKLRSSQVRAVRMRWSAIVFAVSFGTVFGLYLVWRTGEWAVNRFLYENQAFAIRQIELQTDGAISIEQLRRWSGVKPGQNLLALDLARVKRDLELVPVIQSAAVERILPHTLRIRVIEREPLAQVYVPQARAKGGYDMTLFHLDPEGCVMLPLEPRQHAVLLTAPLEQLPTIAGLNFTELRPGRRVDSAQVRAALQLIAAFDRSPMVGLDDLCRIDVSAPEILQVTTGRGSDITFSVRELDRQLRRWREIYDVGEKKDKAIATLDLAVPNNIPARWLEAGAVTPGVPKSTKPPRNRKKNV
jgi:cell division septal protein FtsQ